MHNPLPIPKEGQQGEGSDFSASSILVVLRANPNSGIQNLCSSEPGTLKPAGTRVHPWLVVLLWTCSPEPSG